MKDLGIEAIISFGLSTPALKHDTFTQCYPTSFYCSLYNFLNFPVGVIPVTKVRKDE